MAKATITGELFLSKVINENDVAALHRHGITREHFQTLIEQKAYDFIIKYARENDGNAPSFQSLIAQVPEFAYQATTEDSFKWLGENIKKAKLNLALTSFFNGDEFNKLWAESIKENNPNDFIEGVVASLTEIKHDNRISGKTGHLLSEAPEWYAPEYYDRKAGNVIKFWNSHFKGLDALLGGGYQGGNMYTWFARSGRGKSIVTMVEALSAAIQGANVLMWVLEMPKYEWASRAFAFLSAQEEVKKSVIDGVDYLGGYNVQEMTKGCLSSDEEMDFMQFIQSINEKVAGSITIKAVDDEDFIRRDVRQLERDIVETDAHVVVIDPFYYMSYSKNTSKTAGGDAANTSKELRSLAGRTKVVLHVITQADEDSTEKQGSERELKLPSRSEVKKTKQVLEDASYLLSFDSCDGRFALGVKKGRSGGEGEEIQGIFLPSIGYIKESNDEIVKSLFSTDIDF